MPLWREAHFQVKIKTHQRRITSRKLRFEKVHAVVARSTFRRQHGSNTKDSDHFWEVAMSKKCTPLLARTHFRKQTMFGPLLEVQISKSARCGAKHISKLKCIKPCSDHFWRFRCRFASLHYTLYITLHYTPPHYITHSTPQQYTKLHYTTLRNLWLKGCIGSNPVGLANLILTFGANIHLGCFA